MQQFGRDRCSSISGERSRGLRRMIQGGVLRRGLDAHPAVPVGGRDVRARCGRARPRLDRARRRAAHAGHGRVLRGGVSARRRLLVLARGSTAILITRHRYVCHLAGIGHDAEGVAQTVHEAYRRAECWETYADVTACLRALKERGYARWEYGIELWDAGLRKGSLRDLRLLPYFDTVVSSAVVGYRKPNPISSTWLASRWACAPKRACVGRSSRRADGDRSDRCRHPRGDRRQARCRKIGYSA